MSNDLKEGRYSRVARGSDGLKTSESGTKNWYTVAQNGWKLCSQAQGSIYDEVYPLTL